MKKFFNSVVLALVLLILGVTTVVYAGGHEPTALPCNKKAGCGNEPTPGRGTGVSQCWVTFVAPGGAKGMKLQLFDANGQGLLRNKNGQVALRGAEDETRVSVDCADILRAVKIKSCVYMPPYPDGRPHVRNGEAKGDHYTMYRQYAHHREGVDVQL